MWNCKDRSDTIKRENQKERRAITKHDTDTKIPTRLAETCNFLMVVNPKRKLKTRGEENNCVQGYFKYHEL